MADFTGSMAGADEAVGSLKRSQYGGLAPNNLTTFTLSAGDGHVKIDWAGEDTVIDGMTLCTFAGVLIRRKLGGYPTSIYDGDLVVNATGYSGSYDDTGLVDDTTYYYRAFPYSDRGVYNTNVAGEKPATPKQYTLYGFKIDFNESDPDSMVTYEEAAVGLTPAKMNFSTGVFSDGSWTENVWFRQNNHAYMVKSSGAIDYQLNDSDYTLKAAGGSSDVSNTSYDGNVMTTLTKGYLYIYPDASDSKILHVRICDVKLNSNYQAIGFERSDGTEQDYMLLSTFEGSLVSSKLRSLKGRTPCNSQTGINELTYAAANGSRWSTRSFAQRLYVNCLLVLMFRTTNLQTAMGYGHYTGGSSASNLLTTGTLSDKGAFWGSNSTGKAVKVFHLENWWGNIWERITGCVTDSSTRILIKLKPSYNTTGSGYTDTGVTPTGTSGGYISRMVASSNALIPSVASGSDSTYVPDGLWYAASCYALAGGYCNNGLLVGPFALVLINAVSYSTWGIGAALSCEQPAA